MNDRMQYPSRVSYPVASPRDLLDFLRFLERMDVRMRELRESSALPRTAVTLPDEFDEISAAMLASVRRQAEEAERRGEPLVEAWVDVTPEFLGLARWSRPRMHLLARLVRAGLVEEEWEQHLKFLLQLWDGVYAQLPDEEDADATE